MCKYTGCVHTCISSISLLSLLFCCQVTSYSLPPDVLQHAKLSYPGVCSNSCSLSWWCHQTIESSVTPLSPCPQSFPASGSFPMSQLFTSGCQSITASALASVLAMNIKGWFSLDWLVWSPVFDLHAERAYTKWPPMIMTTRSTAILVSITILN